MYKPSFETGQFVTILRVCTTLNFSAREAFTFSSILVVRLVDLSAHPLLQRSLALEGQASSNAIRCLSPLATCISPTRSAHFFRAASYIEVVTQNSYVCSLTNERKTEQKRSTMVATRIVGSQENIFNLR